MPHLRTQIRNAISTLLTGLATTGSRVEIGRTRPLAAGHQPTLLIYTVEESSGREFDGNPGTLGRTAQVFIDGRVSAAAPPDDLLDQIAFEVEAVMRENPTIGGLAFDSVLSSTLTHVEAEGTAHKGAIRLEYRVRYFVAADNVADGDPGADD